MSGALSDQIEEEGLDLPKPFGTAETKQEHGGRGSHQAHVHDCHVDYFKSGQHGHAHVNRFRGEEGGPRVLETQLSSTNIVIIRTITDTRPRNFTGLSWLKFFIMNSPASLLTFVQKCLKQIT